MKISIYHYDNLYSNDLYKTIKTTAEAIKIIHIMLENNDIEPKDIWASISCSPAEMAEADFAHKMIKVDLDNLQAQFETEMVATEQ